MNNTPLSDIRNTRTTSSSPSQNQPLLAASFNSASEVDDYVQLALKAAEDGNLPFLQAIIDTKASYEDKLVEVNEWLQSWQEAKLFSELNKACLEKINHLIKTQHEANTSYLHRRLLEEKKSVIITELLNYFHLKATHES